MAPSVPSARLLTLGQLALLDGEGRSLVPAGSTKLLGLLAFLAAAPGRRATREHLIDMLWDDVDLKNARASLRQSLHRLRQTLGAAYLPAGDDDIALTDLLACDRDEFLTSVAAGDLDQAISRYGGEYIPGFVSRGSARFEHWRDHERDHLKNLFSAAAETVAQRALEDGTPQVAAALASRLLAVEPLNERVWRLRLRAEQQSGSQVHLVASIAELRRLLADAPFQPDPRTLQLLESLERPAATTPDAATEPELVTDLVGRGPLLTLLYAAWRDTSQSRGVHIHLIGRAGLGKSRLLDDFAARLRSERARVVRARALPRQRFIPGALLSALVGALIELPGAAGMSAQSARVLLPVQPGIVARFPTATPLEFADPDARFLAVLGALEDLFDAISHEAPCCLLIDDAHWWDDYSRRVIEQLLERVVTLPVLAITASRPGHGVLTVSSTRDTLGLTPLTSDDVLALLQSLGEHSDLGAMQRLAEALGRAAHGVPLMVLEGLRLGLDRVLLQLEDRQWCFERLDDFFAILHPGRLLEERLLLLTADQRAFLLTAWFLEMPLATEDLPLLEADAGVAVELERLGFLASNAAGWSVAHDAIGEALEAGSSAEVQQSAHRRAGLVVRKRGDSTTHLVQAARHFVDARADAELTTAAIAWLRLRRSDGSQALPLELLRELLGHTVDSGVLSGLLKRIPPDLRRRPWTTERLMPYALTAGILVFVSGWMITHRPPPPDTVLGILQPDSTGRLVESQIELRERDWALADAVPSGAPADRRSAWDGKFALTDGGPIKDPLRDRWVTTRNMPDGNPTGPTELILYEAGVERALAPAPGDDVLPTWSPDGRYLVFSTTRWSAPGETEFDLGILEVGTGALRRLTESRESDESPYWSPDGTRIAYIRRSTTVGDSLCWIAIDRTFGACRGVPGRPALGLSGWITDEQALVSWDVNGGSQYKSISVDGAGDGPLNFHSGSGVYLSPDGRWLVLDQRRVEGRDAGSSVTISSTSAPTTQHTVLTGTGAIAPRLYWPKGSPRPGLSKVTILRRRDTVLVGVPTRLALEGSDTANRLLPIPATVVRWRSSDSTVATILSTGEVIGRRVGSVTITGSAGGWREASVGLVVRVDAVDSVLVEDWHAEWPKEWSSWGSPLPRLVDRAAGDTTRTMLPNGDGEHSSGLISRTAFDASNGLALDIEVSTPITRPKWQFLQVGLVEPGPMAPSGPIGEGCTLRYPLGEGGENWKTIAGVPVEPGIPAGRWFRLRIQLFPDGTCGVAINGVAVRHDPVVKVTPRTMHVALGGQTVGSLLLVGHVQLLTGVPGDVQWALPYRLPSVSSSTPPRR